MQCVGQRQRANQNTTKAIVIRYMKENKLSSRETTHNIINDLISEGKLNKNEINSQVHYLTINYDNEFIWINKTLNDIDRFIEKGTMISKNLGADLQQSKIIPVYSQRQYVEFLQKFTLPIYMMLNNLLLRTNHTIKLEKDFQLVIRWIVNLMVKLDEMAIWTSDSSRPLNLQFRQIYSGINKLIQRLKP